MDTAKIFWTGRSQAVRLPRAYRFEGREVGIRRVGSAVLLEPIPDNWDWLDRVAGPVDEDFERAALDRAKDQKRPELDEVFP